MAPKTRLVLLSLAAAAAAVAVAAGRTHAGAPAVLWATRLGAAGLDHGWTLALAPSGDVVLSGFGDGPLTAAKPVPPDGPGDGVFVAALSPKGATRWVSRFALPSSFYAGPMGAAAGAIWLTGELRGRATFDRPLESTTPRALFLAKLSAAGKPLWSAHFAHASGLAAAATADGGVVVAGYFSGTTSFGGAPLRATDADSGFAARFDPAGKHVWSVAIPADSATDAATDAADNVYVAGSFRGTLSFGGETVSTKGESDAFVLSLTPSGAPRWLRAAGTPADDKRPRLAVDPAGASTLAWTAVSHSASLPDGNLMVTRFGPEGALDWERALGGKGSFGNVTGLAAAPDGSLALTGMFQRTSDLGAGTLTAEHPAGDGFVAVGGHQKTRKSGRSPASLSRREQQRGVRA